MWITKYRFAVLAGDAGNERASCCGGVSRAVQYLKEEELPQTAIRFANGVGVSIAGAGLLGRHERQRDGRSVEDIEDRKPEIPDDSFKVY